MIPVPDNCLTQLKYNQVESSVLSVVKKKKRTMSTYSRKKKPCLTMFRILSKRKPQNYIRSALLNLKHLFQIYHCGYSQSFNRGSPEGFPYPKGPGNASLSSPYLFSLSRRHTVSTCSENYFANPAPSISPPMASGSDLLVLYFHLIFLRFHTEEFF